MAIISIPDGSIKSKDTQSIRISNHQFQFQMVRLKGLCYNCNIVHPQFQFQMVRLKALTRRFHRNRCRISIPDGSIKRQNIAVQEMLLQQFQFQMVRLKDGAGENPALLKLIFQFQMVRLKVVSIIMRWTLSKNFNSRWFD